MSSSSSSPSSESHTGTGTGTKADPARLAAFDVLMIAEQKLRWRNLRLDKVMNELRAEYQGKYGPQWGGQENSLFHMLVTGVVRHWWQLEWIMDRMTDRDIKHLSAPLKTLLRLGLFQLLHLTEIPDFAAVHSTVNLAQQRKLSKKTVGFVNAVLRNVQRQCDANESAPGTFPFPDTEEDPYGYLMSAQALPRWWARRLQDQFELDTIIQFATAQRQPVPLSIRVNTLKKDIPSALKALTDASIPYHQHKRIPELITLDDFHGQPHTLPGFAEGWLYVQDTSSAMVAPYLNPVAGETVIDLCAAPGSKTSHIAALMENTGTLIACDNKPKRLEMLKENMTRLGVNTLDFCTVEQRNAKDLKQLSDWTGIADKVLVDVPCSGLGTVRKHPEILLNLREKDLTTFPEEQQQILTHALTLAKAGGTVVYSTCSIDPNENQAVVDAVLSQHPNWTKLDEQTILTYATETTHGDGFYMARLQHHSS